MSLQYAMYAYAIVEIFVSLIILAVTVSIAMQEYEIYSIFYSVLFGALVVTDMLALNSYRYKTASLIIPRIILQVFQ